jgi:fibronectin-binding autotransporter adhesin
MLRSWSAPVRRGAAVSAALLAVCATGATSPALAVCAPDLTIQSGVTVTCNNVGAETAQQGNGTNDNVTLTVQPGALINRTGQNLGIQVRSGNAISISGEVRARNAIQVEGSNNSITVGSGGVVRDNTMGTPSAAIRLNSPAGVNNTITIDAGGLVTGNSTTEVIAVKGQATIVNFGTISNTTGGSGNRFAIIVDPVSGGVTNVTNGGIIRGAGGAAAQLSNQNDTWTQLTGATVTGFVNAAGGVDTLVLSGSGSATLNASTIGPTGQWQNFELFEKAGAGTWTLSGSGAQAWTISAGTLIGNATSLQGPITNNATLIFNQTGSGTRAAPISGTGQVIKQGTGTLTLTGANTYTGETLVSAGTLVGNTTSLQGDITNNATLTFNQTAAGTYSDILDGTGLLVKQGAGALTLSGANTYTGGTRIDAGTVRVSAEENLGAPGGRLTFNGGTAVLQYAAGFTSSRPITLNAAGGRIDTTGHDAALAGVIGGPGRLTKLGAGTLTITGSNTYTGGTTVSAGTLVGTTASLRGNVIDSGTLVFDQATAGTFTPVISGTGSVAKQGAGTLTLAGANTYSGGTAINAGTLQVGSNANLGGAAGGISFNGGALQYSAGFSSPRPVTLNAGGGTVNTNGNSATLSGVISGPASLTKTGAGGLTLAGANTYTGGTTIAGGMLGVSADSSLGAPVSSLTLAGGTLRYGAGFSSSRPLTLNVGGGTIDTNGHNATLSGASGGPGGLAKTGAGTLTLLGGNSYSGGTTVSGGTLAGNAASLQGHILNNATLVFDQTTAGTFNGAISGAGAVVKQGAGALTLLGTNSYTGGTTVSAGTLIGNSTSLQGNILNNATLMFDQAASGAYAGVIGGPGAVVKQGGGALTLTGINTYTGGTTVDAGALLVNGAIGSASIAPRAILGGTGAVGPVVINGTLAPASSIGTISTGSLVLNGTYQVEVNAAAQGDRVNVTGTLTLGPTSVLDILAALGEYGSSTSYLIIDNDGTDAVNGAFGTTAINSPFLRASVDYAGGDGNDVVLRLTRTAATFTSVAGTPNQAAVATVLTALEPTATGDLAGVIGQLLTASAPEVRGALDALSGNFLASLDGLDTITAFADAMVSAYLPGAWMIGLGGSTRVDSDRHAASYRSKLAGLALGLNHRVSEEWTAGFGVGYGQTTVDSDQGRASIESLWAALRAIWARRPVRVQLFAGYGYDDVDNDRRIRFLQIDRTATSGFAYNRLTGGLDLGVPLPVGPVALEPFGQLLATTWWRDGYREHGAGDVGLIVDSNHGTSLLTTLGLRGGWTSGIWSAEAVLGWRHLAAGDNFTTEARFVGAPGLPFPVTGVSLARHAILAGAKLGVGPFRIAYQMAAAPGGVFAHSGVGGFEVRW